MTNVMMVGRNILLLFWFALLASAQAQAEWCSTPPVYQHAKLQKKFSTRTWFRNGDKVYYDCAEGYTMSGGGRGVLCKNGAWTKLKLKCIGEISCPSPAVANSVQTGGEVSAYRAGDKVRVTCRQGFRVSGTQQVTCRSDGQWHPRLPQCLLLPHNEPEQPHITEQPRVKDGSCGVPQPASGSNTRLTDQYITKTSFVSGDLVKYECQVGYVGMGGNRYSSCKNGRWTQPSLTCKPKSCGSAGEIQHGQFIYTGSVFGNTATAVCDDGYRLVGRATRNCMNGGWDGRIPTCEAVECEDPPATNAEMLDIRDFYTYSAVVRYRCRGGTLVGQKDIWCTKDGTWSSAPPTCQVMATSCPPPNVANAYWMAPRNNQFQHNEAIHIACNPGYTMTGPNFITCERDGQWSPKLPICRRTYNHYYGWY